MNESTKPYKVTCIRCGEHDHEVKYCGRCGCGPFCRECMYDFDATYNVPTCEACYRQHLSDRMY